jgi:hypothetical protein
MSRMKQTLGTTLAAAIVAVGLAACVQPVTPNVVYQHSTFEGFDVISYVPAHPRALIYLFHGSGGSADFATKVDTVDVLNRFVDKGYGFVSTSSTERTGNKRWDAADPSLTTNPDLARLVRLQQHLVATTGVDAGTPLVGIGMSNGSRFVTLWGQTWKDAGYPVRAIWASHGRTAAPVAAAGGPTVPTVFETSVNDFTSPPGPIIADYQQTLARGTPTRLFESQERPLSAPPFQRIPGIDQKEAGEIVSAFEATGVWNAQGVRVVPDIQQAVAQAMTVKLPAAVTGAGLANDVGNEVARTLAVHQFSSQFAPEVVAFFEQYVG